MSYNSVPADPMPDVQAVLARLDNLPNEERTKEALRVAARFLEYAAYEMAQSDEARHVARLILLAAEMERTSDELKG
ncbi:MAG: hypothetical protein AAGG57_14950 [Pseudomonadota bacterium]